MPRLPKHLYKYQACSAQSLANLTNRQIWCSKPGRFNDPFDCAIRVWESTLTDVELKNLYTRYKTRLPEPNDWDARYLTNGLPNERFREDIARGLEDAFGNRQGAIQERGVACFSKKNHDLLMWAHYADGHRGFCLEFDTSCQPFSRAHRVIYRPTLPSIDVMQLLNAPPSSNVLDALVLTKSDRWKYEQEWRLLNMDGDRQYGYEWPALTGIYLGAVMPEEYKEIICLILRDSPTRLYQVIRKIDGFSLISREFTYTPFRYPEKTGRKLL